jgi:hypothetical protein
MKEEFDSSKHIKSTLNENSMLSGLSLHPESTFVSAEPSFRIELDFFDGLRARLKVEVTNDRHQADLGFEEGKPHRDARSRTLSKSQKRVT